MNGRFRLRRVPAGASSQSWLLDASAKVPANGPAFLVGWILFATPVLLPSTG